MCGYDASVSPVKLSNQKKKKTTPTKAIYSLCTVKIRRVEEYASPPQKQNLLKELSKSGDENQECILKSKIKR